MNSLSTLSSTKFLLAVWNEKKKQLRRSCFGIDRISSSTFERQLNENLKFIQSRLSQNFKPMGLLAIPKEKDSGGLRVICVPTYSDRLIQFGLLKLLKPNLQRMGLDNSVSFGLAPTRERSVLGARHKACALRETRPWVYKADIQKFFDTIDRSILLRAVEKIVRHRSLHPLLRAFTTTEITDGFDPNWKQIIGNAGIKQGFGVRQGMPLSPLLAGAYLRDVDRIIVKSKAAVVRYVDDIAAFFESEKECLEFHDFIATVLGEIGLNIGQVGEANSKSKIYSPDEPAEFLGMEICRGASGKCRLLVSERTISKIECKFAALAAPAELSKKNINLTTMGTYFGGIERGYENAYAEAHNRDVLKVRLSVVSTAAQNQVLFELFGDRLDHLSPAARKFVGISEPPKG